MPWKHLERAQMKPEIKPSVNKKLVTKDGKGTVEEEESVSEKVKREEYIKWMTTAPGQESESYWKLIAAERQAATEATLEENNLLREQIAAIRKENEALAAIADQKEYMESVAEQILESIGTSDLPGEATDSDVDTN